MSQSSFRTARSAWQHLVKQGGLDIADRDQPLVQTLKYRLNPHALSVDDALEGVSIEGFLNAFFGTITPFVAMMQDLLDYFKSAGATDGPEAWTLVLGEGADRLEVNLDHFRKWIEREATTLKQHRQVPVLNYQGLWHLREHFFLLQDGEKDSHGQVWHLQPKPSITSDDLAAWLRAYEEGIYSPLPHFVQDVYHREGVISDIAALLIEIYGAITALAPTRHALEERGRYSSDLPTGDFWSVDSLRQFESDFWVQGRVLDLAAWLEAPADRQWAVTESIENQLRDLPKRTARLDVTIQEIEEILSLPIWKRRYELYSAWVLTSALQALKGHSIRLHHDHGSISFSFRETLMVSILSSSPPLQIFAEKRTAAENLVGHGRSSGVQPDYSLWTETGVCRLAIECKHYKRSSTRNFADALNDYSCALPAAKVILVNYGPVSTAVEKAISASRSDRCKALGNVYPEATESLAAFEKLVCRAVGEPVPIPFLENKPLGGLGDHPILLVDVSGSMRSTLAHDRTISLIDTLVRTNEIKMIVAADDRQLMETGVSVGEIARAIAVTGTGSTSLSHPIHQLLERFTSVIVLTDSGGASDVIGFPHVRREVLRIGGSEVFLISVTR